MKKAVQWFRCISKEIKKIFFNVKNDQLEECDRLLTGESMVPEPEEINRQQEYLENYRVTTRWQTV